MRPKKEINLYNDWENRNKPLPKENYPKKKEKNMFRYDDVEACINDKVLELDKLKNYLTAFKYVYRNCLDFAIFTEDRNIKETMEVEIKEKLNKELEVMIDSVNSIMEIFEKIYFNK